MHSAGLADYHPVSRPDFDQYSKKYDDTFKMERRDGILQVQFQTAGGPGGGSGWIDVWSQAWWEIGNDPKNEIVIITGTGDRWITLPGDRGVGNRPAPTQDTLFETYYDAIKNTENLIFGINVPTIGAINGPAALHVEFALLCDITLCTERSFFRDPHAAGGGAPGDGLGMAFQWLMGPKRAAYYLYTGEILDAKKALEFGLVNEVVSDDRLLPRAWEIAEQIKTNLPKLPRLMAKQIVRRQFQEQHVRDAAFHFAHQMVPTGVAPGADAPTPEQRSARRDAYEEKWRATTGTAYST